jgi:DNA-binding Lrp family transcriptional regulator
LLDWKIYRELYRLSDDPLWGMYPHPPLETIAERLGVSRNTVWERLRSWKRDGFFLGYEVFPNPGLLGVGFEIFSVVVPNPAARRRLVDELELVDGVFLATSDVGQIVEIFAVADSPESRSRRERLLRRIDGVDSVRARRSIWLPTGPSQISQLDWAVVATLRRLPTAPMERVGKAVGRSAKMVAGTMRRLRQSHALLSYSIEDFTRFPGTVAVLVLRLEPGRDSRIVAADAQSALPDALEAPLSDRPYQAPAPYLVFLQWVSAAGGIELLASDAASVNGVARVEQYFLGWTRVYRHWFDERLFEIAGGSSSVAREARKSRIHGAAT